LFYLYGTDIHEVLDVALHLRTHGGIHERTFVRRDCYYWSLFFLFFCLFFTHPRTHIRQKRLLLLVSIFSFLFFFSLHIHERTFVRRDLRVSKKETHLYPWEKKKTYLCVKRDLPTSAYLRYANVIRPLLSCR
jgi:uncharacterized membrane protein